MKVTNYSSNIYSSPYFKQRKTTFSHTEPKANKANLKEFVTPKPITSLSANALAALLLLSSFNYGDKNHPEVITQNIDNTEITYYDINSQINNKITSIISNLKNNLPDSCDFLENVKFSVASDFSKFDGRDSLTSYVLKNINNYKNYQGLSYYSESIPKNILIQTSKIIRESEYKDLDLIKFALLHEIGHQFDKYFRENKNTSITKEWESITLSKYNSPNDNPYYYAEDISEVINKYNENNGLSDKPEFKKAYDNDKEHIFEKIQDLDELAPIQYYIPDLECGDDENLSSDHNRSEVYASSFSYLMGAKDEDKAIFEKLFSNSLQVVKKDIEKHFGASIEKIKVQ